VFQRTAVDICSTYPLGVPDTLQRPHEASRVAAVLGGAFAAWACAEVLLGLIPIAADWAGGVRLHVSDAVETVAAFGWIVGPVALLVALTSAAVARQVTNAPLAQLLSHAAVGAVAALLIGVVFGVESGLALGVAAATGAVSAMVGSFGARWASRRTSRVAALGLLAIGLWLGAVAATG